MTPTTNNPSSGVSFSSNSPFITFTDGTLPGAMMGGAGVGGIRGAKNAIDFGREMVNLIDGVNETSKSIKSLSNAPTAPIVDRRCRV